MSIKLLALASALAAAGPASAITINMSNFAFGDPSSAVMTGSAGAPSYDGAAGEFLGQSAGSSSSAASSNLLKSNAITAEPASFDAWCAELTQDFNFGVSYEYQQVAGSTYFSTQKTTDLSRLFTAAEGFVVDGRTSAAMQAGIWEIIYETGTGYGFKTGSFHGAADNSTNQGAFDTVDSFLTNLGTYRADFRIDVLTNPDRQDFLVATIPEPETWAMLMLGLGVLGWAKRRRKV